MSVLKEFKVDKLNVQVYASRKEMGEAAARIVRKKISDMLKEKETINMIFAAAPSQNEFLANLIEASEIEWSRINAFHMDEYIGISPKSPQSFGYFLRTNLFDLVNFKEIYYISPNNPENEAKRYAELLKKYPPDIVCLGIGENGHLAFNDPPVADFEDPELVKIVELDDACIQQQVNDGCFETISDVPKTAITLTIPALMSAKFMCCVVPGITKANAVKKTLTGEISTNCPASILRTHDNAVLYLDEDSFSNQ